MSPASRRMALPQRKNIRLHGFDYKSNLAYFVTICTQNRQCVFGTIENDLLRPSRRGLIATECWMTIPRHHPHVRLDRFVVMPNHVHGIVCFVGPVDTSTLSITLPSQSLGAVIGTYKAAVTRAINAIRPQAANGLWQRGYYDHVIRHERAYEQIWQYIDANPRRWNEDEENPDAVRPVTLPEWLKHSSPDSGDMYVAPTKI